MYGKGKAIPVQARTGPEGSRWVRLPEFLDNRHVKAVRLSADPRAGRLFPPPPPRYTPGTHFCLRLSWHQGHTAAGRIMSMKSSNDPNRKSNPRPCRLYSSASTNCVSAYLHNFVCIIIKNWALCLPDMYWYQRNWMHRNELITTEACDLQHSCY
jgi:hypothetical protein